MRIGVVAPLVQSRGGVYQYTLSVLNALRDCQATKETLLQVIVFADVLDHPELARLADYGVAIQQWPTQSRALSASSRHLRRLAGEGRVRDALRWTRRRLKAGRSPKPDLDHITARPDLGRLFHDAGAGLVLYPSPTNASFEAGTPYVMAVHDLQHRIHPEFPEVSANGEWEQREHMFRNGARHATLVLADSEVGKEDILSFYGAWITEDRVKVLPFVPPPYLGPVSPEECDRILATLSLPHEYVFCPAQFWPHKNHVRLVGAVGLIKQEFGLDIPLVLTGSADGEIRGRTSRKALSLARRLGVQVRYLGYVPDDVMAALYSSAGALVLPTFFGPTIIPMMEAWKYDCPVVTSDIRGIREQAAGTAVLVDPRSEESIAHGIYRLWTDGELRRSMVEGGRAQLAAYTPDQFRQRLVEILDEAWELARASY